MPYRKIKVEDNLKYIPRIIETLNHIKYNNSNLSEINIKDRDFDNILIRLSENIYLKEHRLRYQQEQHFRLIHSRRYFNFFYRLQNKNLEQFLEDYNHFLWKEIKNSHLNLSPKIEANYRRNYHEGEVSAITSLVFYLYFRTGKLQKFISKVLMGAYRNPYLSKQKIQI